MKKSVILVAAGISKFLDPTAYDSWRGYGLRAMTRHQSACRFPTESVQEFREIAGSAA